MSQLTLNSPVIITPRLLPGLQIGNAFISIEYAGRTTDYRQQYRYTLDIGKRFHIGTDLASGCQGGSLQEGLRSLLSFLSACGEAKACFDRGYTPSDNLELFPAWVATWCTQYSDELSMAAIELEELDNLIVEG